MDYLDSLYMFFISVTWPISEFEILVTPRFHSAGFTWVLFRLAVQGDSLRPVKSGRETSGRTHGKSGFHIVDCLEGI